MSSTNKSISLFTSLIAAGLILFACKARLNNSDESEIPNNGANKINSQLTYDTLKLFADSSYHTYLYNNLKIAKRCYSNMEHLIPNDQYSILQLKKTDEQIGRIESDHVFYKSLINKADLRFDSKSFIAAKGIYQRASYIRPNDAYPKKLYELSESIDSLNLEFSLNAVFDSLIQCGYKYFLQQEYEQSKKYFERANQIKPNEIIPIQRMSEINHMIDINLKEDSTYNARLNIADSIFQAGSYYDAMHSYEKSYTSPPNGRYTMVMIYACRLLLERN